MNANVRWWEMTGQEAAAAIAEDPSLWTGVVLARLGEWELMVDEAKAREHRLGVLVDAERKRYVDLEAILTRAQHHLAIAHRTESQARGEAAEAVAELRTIKAAHYPETITHDFDGGSIIVCSVCEVETREGHSLVECVKALKDGEIALAAQIPPFDAERVVEALRAAAAALRQIMDIAKYPGSDPATPLWIELHERMAVRAHAALLVAEQVLDECGALAQRESKP